MAWYPSLKSEVPPLAIVEWSSGTDEEIAAMLQAHYDGLIDIHDYWTVGDERTVSLSAMSATEVDESHAQQSVVFVLSNSGGKYLSDGVTECAFQVDQKNSLNEKGCINSISGGKGNTGGWKSSDRRAWCNSVYKNAVPSTLRGIFKDFINQSGLGGGSSSGVENTTDTFALRAEVEVFNVADYSVSGEGTQVTWYETASNRYKKVNNANYGVWWFRSPSKYNDSSFVEFSYGSVNHGTYYDSQGIAPFGVI